MQHGLMLRAAVTALAALAFAAPAVALETFHGGTPVGRNFTFLPLRIAEHNGFFKKNGLDIEVTDFGGGAKLQQAFVAGAIDLAVSAGTDMAFIAKGADEKAIAVAGTGTSLALLVPWNSPAKTPRDLKGKHVGVSTAGSFTEWTMKHYLRQHGLPLDYVHIDHIGSGLANDIALLTTGRIDAVVAPAALGFNLELKKRARLLIPHFDLGMPFVGQALYASGPMIRNHPGAVRRFVKAWFENIAWMASHRAETIKLVRRYTHFAPSVEAKEYDQGMPMFSRTGKFSKAALRNLGRTFVDMGILPKPPDMAKLITTRFLPKR